MLFSSKGPTWHGRGGVHTHMTNTRITDPEILERRYDHISFFSKMCVHGSMLTGQPDLEEINLD